MIYTRNINESEKRQSLWNFVKLIKEQSELFIQKYMYSGRVGD